VSLRYLAKGDFYSEAGDIHGISRSSVCQILHRVVAAINDEVSSIRYLKKKFSKLTLIFNYFGLVVSLSEIHIHVFSQKY